MRFSLARESSSGLDVPLREIQELGDCDLEAGREVLLPRADVEPDLAGVRVLGEVAVDRVRHPTLLADLLEEPRGGRAAENRVEDGGGEAALVRAVDPRRGKADVVLLGVLPLEAKSRPGKPSQRLARERPPACSRSVAPLAEQCDEALVAEVPRRSEDDARAGIRTAVVGGERPGRHGLDHVRPTDHGPTERVPAEHRVGGEVVHEVMRSVLDHRDLLEHDLPLGVDIPERGAEHHVGHHVERGLEAVVRDPGVDDGRLARGRRIQLAAELVEDLGDLLRAVPRGALEEQVLDEVGDPGARLGLVARAGADPEAERDRPDAGQALRDDALPTLELGQLVAHSAVMVDGGGRRRPRPHRYERSRSRGRPRPRSRGPRGRSSRSSRGGAFFARSISSSGWTRLPFSCLATSLSPIRPRSLSTSWTSTSSTSPRVITSSM